jgi:hypothetical protein
MVIGVHAGKAEAGFAHSKQLFADEFHAAIHCAALRQIEIVLVAAGVVGVAFYAQLPIGLLLQDVRDFIEYGP